MNLEMRPTTYYNVIHILAEDLLYLISLALTSLMNLRLMCNFYKY